MTAVDFNFPWVLAKGKGPRRAPSRRDLERLAALRHVGGGPFGPGGPMSGHPFGGGRGRRRRGDVRVALLLLLAEEPRNGYQLMQDIEQRSGGRWRPSPGSVYPTLAQLQDEGLIQAAEADGGKLFELTDAGRAHLAERHAEPPPWDPGDDAAAETFADIRSLIAQTAQAAWLVGRSGDAAQVQRARDTLIETRRSLYRILADETDD